MNDHFATEQEARDAVQDFIRGWELDAALARGPGAFELQFDKSAVVDRRPTPGVIQARANPARFTFSASPVQGTVSPRDYPKPPSTRLTLSLDVESMFLRQRLEPGEREREGSASEKGRGACAVPDLEQSQVAGHSGYRDNATCLARCNPRAGCASLTPARR